MLTIITLHAVLDQRLADLLKHILIGALSIKDTIYTYINTIYTISIFLLAFDHYWTGTHNRVVRLLSWKGRLDSQVGFYWFIFSFRRCHAFIISLFWIYTLVIIYKAPNLYPQAHSTTHINRQLATLQKWRSDKFILKLEWYLIVARDKLWIISNMKIIFIASFFWWLWQGIISFHFLRCWLKLECQLFGIFLWCWSFRGRWHRKSTNFYFWHRI